MLSSSNGAAANCSYAPVILFQQDGASKEISEGLGEHRLSRIIGLERLDLDCGHQFLSYRWFAIAGYRSIVLMNRTEIADTRS